MRIHYARFHKEVPPAKDKEPVSEFQLTSKTGKYAVDSLEWTSDGVIYEAFGERGIVPLANVIYCRFTL